MNILVAKNYDITDHTTWYNNRSSETGLKSNYDQMEEIMIESARNHLCDLDDVIVHRGEAASIRDVFKIHFVEIYELWKQGHNILYCDLDVVFINRAEYFGKFDQFMMFNYTDPKTTTDSHYNLTFNHFFNCGIRYYPKDMSQEIWDLGFEMLDNWNPNRWDSEQIIYNAMMWKQPDIEKICYRPDLAYQLLHTNTQYTDAFNQIQLPNASAVHVHGSRGSQNRMEIMRQLLSMNS